MINIIIHHGNRPTGLCLLSLYTVFRIFQAKGAHAASSISFLMWISTLSKMGRGEFFSLRRRGSSVQPRITAWMPCSFFILEMRSWNSLSVSSLTMPSSSSSKMRLATSSLSSFRGADFDAGVDEVFLHVVLFHRKYRAEKTDLRIAFA